MALPILQNPGSPAFPVLPDVSSPASTSKRPFNAKLRAADHGGRRPSVARRHSLKRVKDSTEELRRARSRTIETSTSIASGSTLPLPSASTGRSFTVANVNNGILYLRPVVRPGNQRSRPTPDPFVFPPRGPVDKAPLDPSSLRPPSHDWRESVASSNTHTRAEPPTPLPLTLDADRESQNHPRAQSPPPRPIPHVRSRSFSTVDEHAPQAPEPGTFKVVIERPSNKRPKTADTPLPILQVPIPHYRLGTPHFSARGTAILRSSVYTRASGTPGTEDFRSSVFTPQRATHSFLSTRRRSEVYSPASIDYRLTADKMPAPMSTSPSEPAPEVTIGPQLYDALAQNPDDASVVRFSPSGAITAATPSRLIAHITSPSFLDYELLSDFFLTFRSFLTSKDLVAYLISRLRWAVNRQDDFGRIVRVRTFVALRHWILNYFVDDFVPYYSLRAYFCELVNTLYNDLKNRADGGGGDIKIVGELKKCWRRTCALYWEADGIDDVADNDLLPGGGVESHASIEELPPVPATPPRAADTTRPRLEQHGSNPSDQFTSKLECAQRSRHTPQNSLSSPYMPSQDNEGGPVPLSPASEMSIPVLSCSIPMRSLKQHEGHSEVPLYPHPVPHPATSHFRISPQYSASIGRPNRPSHSHKRSGSFSDALRDHRAPLSIPKNVAPDGIISPVAKMPGSLVHGGLYQPGSPYIDIKTGSLHQTKSYMDFDQAESPRNDHHHFAGSPNPGMKKLFGTVRRALSSKQNSTSTAYLPASQTGPSARSSNPGTISSVSGGVRKRRYHHARSQTRIDVLALQVSESFHEAIKQEMREDGKGRSSLPVIGSFDFGFDKHGSDPSSGHLKVGETERAQLYSNVTAGSRSIVIVDDTAAPALPLMSGALRLSKTSSDLKDETEEMLYQLNSSPAGSTVHEVEEFPETEPINITEEPTARQSFEVRPKSDESVLSPMERKPSITQLPHRTISVKRRGSARVSSAHSLALRRHASHNSGLMRRKNAASYASTFQTMSSDNDSAILDDEAVGPARLLRRRPGGDLRAVDNVHDLEQITRPRSTGSVSNRTHSISNSIILRSDKYIDSVGEDRPQQPLSEPPPKKSISLVATHSSQPNLRPSFEAEVAKLAALPDDADDDGGPESALLKLEGRYEKKSPASQQASSPSTTGSETYSPIGASVDHWDRPQAAEVSEYGNYQTKSDEIFDRFMSPVDGESQTVHSFSQERPPARAGHALSATESDDSYSSVPLLDRGLSEIAASPLIQSPDSMASSAKPEPLNTKVPRAMHDWTTSQLASPDSSVEYVIKTDSLKRIPRGETHPRASAPRQSFLLDEDEDLSDMVDDDSAIAARSEGTSHGVRSFFDDEPAVMEPDKDIMPTHPMRHPPTPPLTANRLNDALPPVDTSMFQQQLPTPGLTPTSRVNNQTFGQTQDTAEPGIEMQQLEKKKGLTPSHIPFILAYDSDTVAQQLTIVEKDALDEIDWKELIELRWKQSSPQIRDWVQYLRTQEARGVDVVIARFNLVVKWAVSEILLTESVEERARCIVKYIHIAAHSRRLRNYATMYQITIALLSTDISRLKKTWELIPAAELHAMRDLENLVQPVRNFHNLRVEMETATVEEGCIPFIGIYTRDLIYNAQKPAFISTSSEVGGERLVNFERHHTAAMIVKSLLRLLEASSKYSFKPEPHILSKCLWLAALDDQEIIRLSRTRE